MRFNGIKVFSLLAFLIGFFCVFYTQFETVALAISAVLVFVIVYMMALYYIKKWQGHILKKVIYDCVEFVPPEVASSVEPHTRGLLVFGDLRLFSRVSVNGEGIYLYKQGCYSFRIPWNSVLVLKKHVGFNSVALRIKKSGEDRILLPWSSEFDLYLR